MTASAVHGAKPSFSPAKILARFTGLIPSRSFSGRIISSKVRPFMWRGRGQNNRIPSMEGSSLIFWNSAWNSPSLMDSGNAKDRASMPKDAIFFITFLSYDRSSGLSPTRTMAAVGTWPPSPSTISCTSFLILAAASDPFNTSMQNTSSDTQNCQFL